jgi:hypothetical protein
MPTNLRTRRQPLGGEHFSERSKARLHQTQHPNALPAFPHSRDYPGQPGRDIGSYFILFPPLSPSVMDATVPAMPELLLVKRQPIAWEVPPIFVLVPAAASRYSPALSRWRGVFTYHSERLNTRATHPARRDQPSGNSIAGFSP